MTVFLTPTWIAPYLPVYRRLVRYTTQAFDICKKHVDNAIAEVKDDDDTVIAKLVRKCGKDSPIPLIMGIDALQVGIDTTGTSASFLLYHLASNPDASFLNPLRCWIYGDPAALDKQRTSALGFKGSSILGLKRSSTGCRILCYNFDGDKSL